MSKIMSMLMLKSTYSSNKQWIFMGGGSMAEEVGVMFLSHPPAFS
jgi:hypothetical protein